MGSPGGRPPRSASSTRRPRQAARPTGGATARSTRPAPSARAKDLTAVPPKRSRVRWLALVVIAVVLVITLAPTARSLLRQRAEIADLREQISQQEQRVEALRAEDEQWRDPAYVEQQARERLRFVKPGERSYTVLDPQEVAKPLPSEVTVAASPGASGAPWYAQVWQSTRLADQPTSGLVPVAER